MTNKKKSVCFICVCNLTVTTQMASET